MDKGVGEIVSDRDSISDKIYHDLFPNPSLGIRIKNTDIQTSDRSISRENQ
jgi:hypothetical protein